MRREREWIGAKLIEFRITNLGIISKFDMQAKLLNSLVSRWLNGRCSNSFLIINLISTNPTEARDRWNFLNPPMNRHTMPLMVVESHASRFNVHFLFSICESHRQRNATIANRQVQIIGSVAWTKRSIKMSLNGLLIDESLANNKRDIHYASKSSSTVLKVTQCELHAKSTYNENMSVQKSNKSIDLLSTNF